MRTWYTRTNQSITLIHLEFTKNNESVYKRTLPGTATYSCVADSNPLLRRLRTTKDSFVIKFKKLVSELSFVRFSVLIRRPRHEFWPIFRRSHITPIRRRRHHLLPSKFLESFLFSLGKQSSNSRYYCYCHSPYLPTEADQLLFLLKKKSFPIRNLQIHCGIS